MWGDVVDIARRYIYADIPDSIPTQTTIHEIARTILPSIRVSGKGIVNLKIIRLILPLHVGDCALLSATNRDHFH